jgi:uncharacterized protein YciI
MARWVVIFTDTSEMLAIRAQKHLRDAHVAYVKNHPELLIGGGLKPDIHADFCGAMWVVETGQKSDVETLVTNDPFYYPEFRTYEIFTWGKILEDRTATL